MWSFQTSSELAPLYPETGAAICSSAISLRNPIFTSFTYKLPLILQKTSISWAPWVIEPGISCNCWELHWLKLDLELNSWVWVENFIRCHLESHGLDCSQKPTLCVTLRDESRQENEGGYAEFIQHHKFGEKKPQNNQGKKPKFPILEQHSCRTTCDGSGEVAASVTQRYPDESDRKGNSWKTEVLHSQSWLKFLENPCPTQGGAGPAGREFLPPEERKMSGMVELG